MAIGSWPGSEIIQNPSPPIEFMWGYTTGMVAAAATIASIALPPSRKTVDALLAARWCGAVTMPREDVKVWRIFNLSNIYQQ
jgi:hypothetical protein